MLGIEFSLMCLGLAKGEAFGQTRQTAEARVIRGDRITSGFVSSLKLVALPRSV